MLFGRLRLFTLAAELGARQRFIKAGRPSNGASSASS